MSSVINKNIKDIYIPFKAKTLKTFFHTKYNFTILSGPSGLNPTTQSLNIPLINIPTGLFILIFFFGKNCRPDFTYLLSESLHNFSFFSYYTTNFLQKKKKKTNSDYIINLYGLKYQMCC